MAERKSDNVENRNRAVEQKEEELRHPAKRPPHDQQAQPSPKGEVGREPPVDAPEHLDNPPQTEGPRERTNEAV